MQHAQCPEDLLPESVVPHLTPSLFMTDDEARIAIRAEMSCEEIKAEIEAISAVAQKRSDFGIYGLLGLVPIELAYGCTFSGESPLNWMHEHERKRLQQLKCALPTAGEEAIAARQRILARRLALKTSKATSRECTADATYSATAC